MRETPPSASAVMTCTKRSFALHSGWDHHVRRGPSLLRMLEDSRGTREVHVSATGPRSMTSTDTLGSSLNLEASTQPDVPPGDGLSQRGQKRKQYPTPGLTSNDNIIIRVRPWGNFGRYGDWGPNVLWVKLRYTSHGDTEGLRRNTTGLEGKWRGGQRTPLSLRW